MVQIWDNASFCTANLCKLEILCELCSESLLIKIFTNLHKLPMPVCASYANLWQKLPMLNFNQYWFWHILHILHISGYFSHPAYLDSNFVPRHENLMEHWFFKDFSFANISTELKKVFFATKLLCWFTFFTLSYTWG